VRPKDLKSGAVEARVGVLHQRKEIIDTSLKQIQRRSRVIITWFM